MQTIYIQFDDPEAGMPPVTDSRIKQAAKKIMVNLLSKLIPKANPDFDDAIEKVKYWLLECDVESGIPQREIGIDEQGRVLLKMPYKDNYGYWTDNNMLLHDFKEHFNVSEITKDSFEQAWSSLTK